MVSWRDVIAYCNKRSIAEGLETCYKIVNGTVKCDHITNGYRLPTEAEWEFAARGGKISRDFRYAGSDVLDEVGWYNSNSGGQTHEVGLKKENELGLHDMSGNIWEWCWDYFGCYGMEDQVDPTGSPEGRVRVYRGGSFVDFAYGCTVTIRGSRPENRGYGDIGFRTVRTCM
jgi:formylglycine-generating enzyme required for sulfatase activity